MSKKTLPSRGQLVRIETMIPGGRGMARLEDGRPAFVGDVTPGDEVEILEATEKKSFVQVKQHILKQAGTSRVSSEEVQSRCAVHRECGGCDWIAMTPEAQKEQKLAIVRQALIRTGGVDVEALQEPLKLTESPVPFAYRSRIRLHVKDGDVGFFRAESHTLVEPTECAVASPELNELLNWVRPIVKEARGDFSVVASLELRHMGSDNSSIHLSIKKGKSVAKSSKRLRRLFESRPEVVVRIGDEPAPLQEYFPQANTSVRVAPGAFTQVNEAINEKMVESVIDVARVLQAKSFLDLYCGAGNFSLPLLSLGLSGLGVEVSGESIDAARLSATSFKEKAQFLCAPAEGKAESLALEGSTYDLVVVDPPRAGAKDLLAHLPKLVGLGLLMISCDPVTLARDLKQLTDNGMELRWIRPFDMFPQTHHVETMALLTPTS